MKTSKQYEDYVVKTVKILEDYFKLPNIPVKIDKRNNCSFVWSNEKATTFLISLVYVEDIYANDLDNRAKRYGCKIKSLKELLLRIILHEIGHYKDYYNNKTFYIRETKEEEYIEHNERQKEIRADNFSKIHYKEAKLFLKECVK